ncbi:MAG: hypothetical protein DCC67_19665 [Planctomycetota bacterium]|nr:MAG: hypothetical protein DCC67_19665 [Planctomycetota bacterium]
MRVLALIASDGNRLPRGDRAAAALALAVGEGSATALHLPDDLEAAVYARAAGLATAPWAGRLAAFDALLAGPGAVDRLGDVAVGGLAEEACGSLAFDVLSATRSTDGWLVEADAGRGARVEIAVTGPLVAVLSNDAPRPPYVSHWRRRAARIHDRGRSDAAVPHGDGAAAWGPIVARPPRQASETATAESRTNAAFGIAESPSLDSAVVTGTAAECARILLRYLIDQGFVASAATMEATAESTAADTNPLAARSAAAPAAARAVGASPGELTAAQARAPRTSGDTPSRRGRRPRPLVPASAERQ